MLVMLMQGLPTKKQGIAINKILSSYFSGNVRVIEHSALLISGLQACCHDLNHCLARILDHLAEELAVKAREQGAVLLI